MAEAQKKPARAQETTAEFVARVNKPSGKRNGLRRMKAQKRRARKITR